MRRLLCRLGLFHKWQPISGLAPLGYINRQCVHCGAKKFHRLRGHDYEKQWETWETNYEAREKYFADGDKNNHG